MGEVLGEEHTRQEVVPVEERNAQSWASYEIERTCCGVTREMSNKPGRAP
jgi:hypothetical protein